MTKSNKAAVHIQQANKKKTLSAAQKKFNSLVKKIDKEKKCLQDWQAFTPDYQQKLNQKFQPLQKKFCNLLVMLVRRLDGFHGRRSFTQTQKEEIAHTICNFCVALVEYQGVDDLNDIYQKYSGTALDTVSEDINDAVGDMMKEMFEDGLGIDLGDDFDCTDPEVFAQRVAEKMQALEDERAEQGQCNSETAQTKKQRSNEARRMATQKAEQDNISQSLKTIYRQLITTSHPDRETDPDERIRKTEIMQRVNTAYKQKDLLKLLELQLELEQIDQHHINAIAVDQLKAYNKILQNQLEQLQLEVQQVEMPFRMNANISPYVTIRPKLIMDTLDADILDLKENVSSLEEELQFLTTVKNVKIWLREGSSVPVGTPLPGNLFEGMDDFDFR